MITSKDNEQIKFIQKLQTKKHRDLTQSFMIYGEHVIQEAIKQGFELDIYTTNPDHPGTQITESLMKLVSLTETPMMDLAIVKKKEASPYTNRILMLDDVQDPGNLGTLIRSAVGFGFTTIIASNNSADFYNDKTIRATQGNLFYANLIRTDLKSEIESLKKDGYTIFATALHQKAIDIKSIQVPEKAVLVLGNEGAGVSKEILDLSDYCVFIKTKDIESLNVAMAGSIIMYEWQV
ncbi:RNA methyltransferase [Acholeplasma vituli]|uniref:RNA methyltransferase n=1 Tax=Paracholeplasma vituli TaxID=69473 RepID=A0ABT2PWZ7_9MOLU|nr:RNA methyltransferase [Paracholeplasma vituli]MCU0105447.1 RNA methyltransferase [Paracholeplasma vituli]